MNEDVATFSFNYVKQVSELKAINRRTGQEAIREYDSRIFSLGAAITDHLTVIEDVNGHRESWGWIPTQVSDWHGVRDWVVALTPAD